MSDSKTLAIQRLEICLEVQSDIVDAVAHEFDRLFPERHVGHILPNTCLEVQIVFLPDTQGHIMTVVLNSTEQSGLGVALPVGLPEEEAEFGV